MCLDSFRNGVVHNQHWRGAMVVIDAVSHIWHLAIAQVAIVERDHRYGVSVATDHRVRRILGAATHTMRAPRPEGDVRPDVIVPFLTPGLTRVFETRHGCSFLAEFILDFNFCRSAPNHSCGGANVNECCRPRAYGSREDRRLPHAVDLRGGQRPCRAKTESTSISFEEASRLRFTGFVRLRVSGLKCSGGVTQVGRT